MRASLVLCSDVSKTRTGTSKVKRSPAARGLNSLNSRGYLSVRGTTVGATFVRQACGLIGSSSRCCSRGVWALWWRDRAVSRRPLGRWAAVGWGGCLGWPVGRSPVKKSEGLAMARGRLGLNRTRSCAMMSLWGHMGVKSRDHVRPARLSRDPETAEHVTCL